MGTSQAQTTARPQTPSFSRAGVSANASGCVLDFLLQRFPQISAATWLERFAQGLVCNPQGTPLQASDSIRGISHVLYQRQVADEKPIPFEAKILLHDEHLLIADKPHFLPVMPAGQYVQQTLLYRLQQQTGLQDIAPLHRIDRDTAGLVMFSINPTSRNAYHELFRERRIRKVYHAVAAFDSRFLEPQKYRSHMQEDPVKFFRMCELAGAPNSHTQLQILHHNQHHALYQLEPITGKRHQLRVHMAALGIPIMHDSYYPVLQDDDKPEYSQPLQLLARHLLFTDPVTGLPQNISSQQQLHLPDLAPTPA